ncbi:MAG: WecB/TagA/CpsF family glycosyltransferase [Eisenbergiella porci]|uniref:WecB/TagA/CpsF family glycosyltransferase n=1 Tax=Eisenbergiella porci TaxID=2652274 RepID=UPI002A75B92E|nr:WecB/TagA/CpsF family glycosyltransferase [Eisenbergiella porci]MDY2651708.1 WecB/TagA/CpsF family glycosyltransferase [Eisenbergiella porci]
MEKTVSYIEQHLDELKGHYICVSNVHTTVTAYRDEEYRNVQNNAAMNIPDGKPLSIVQRHSGFKNAGRVPGPDLMPEIFRLSEKKGYRHYFYGSRQETLDALKVKLAEEYPKLKIAGMYSPPFRPMTEEEDEEAIRNINECNPDFIWIGLGAPKQEKWMAAHDGRVCGVMLGVGAGFDFHAGTIKRAPLWMQEFCMEWLFRIGQDPKRLFPRYLDTNFSFVFYLFREWLKGKNGIDRKHYLSEQTTICGKEIPRGKKGRPLRVAMIGHKRIPSREGGVEIVVDELSTRMVKLGCEVDAYNRYGKHTAGKRFDERRGKYYNGIRLITIPTPKSSSLNAIVYSFLAALRSLFGVYDVIHFHAEGPCTMLCIPKIFGIHTVATIHGLDWQRSKWGNFASKVLKSGERMAAKHADEVIVLSQNMQVYFREVYQRETHFIPNGINCPEIRANSLIKETYGLEKDGYLLFLARIVPEKGLHYLIEAFGQVKTSKKLVIAGGSSHSHEYMDKIRSMAAQDNRIIMTDFVHGQCLEELYSNAYLFVLPSDVEGMALGLLEAMSFGNCCVVSDIEENKEVVEEHAVTFQKGNVQDLKEKLQQLIDSPEEVLKYKKTSQEFICEKYNWDSVVNETLTLYNPS